MKSASAGLTGHLAGTVTTLCTLWTITRQDGTVYRFTDNVEDISYGGNTYAAAYGYDRTAMESQLGLAVNNMDLMGFLDSSALTDRELRAGLFDHAEVEVWLVNFRNTAQGHVIVATGTLGEISYSPLTGAFNAEMRGLAQRFSQNILNIYQKTCRADLGDSLCKIPIAPAAWAASTAYAVGDYVTASSYDGRIYECTTAGTSGPSSPGEPSWNTTIGATTSDNTVVWTARDSWTKQDTVAAVTDNRTFNATGLTAVAFVDDWFKFGGVHWLTGDNAGLTMEVKGWAYSGQEVELFLAMPFDIQIGDTFEIYPGCDKKRTTCRDKFDNILNRRAEDYVPGQDEFLDYPDAP